jgi:AcrR family transcriptional regulator
MENRCRILAAAARVYAEFGFRGATTRRIASAAGVNEVTLFRTFGSKEALIAQALQEHARSGPASAGALPEHPVDPERELVAWAAAQLADLREHRSLIRKSMSEIEERPELAPCVTAGWATCDALLHDYLVRLRALGFIAPGAEDDVLAGGAMLMGALFSDAMGRDMLPALFPQPEQSAPAVYVRLFLRAVACRGAAADAPAALAASGAHPEPPTSR